MSALSLRMLQVFPVQPLGITENCCCFFKGNAMFGLILESLPSVPDEHITVYTLNESGCQIGQFVIRKKNRKRRPRQLLLRDGDRPVPRKNRRQPARIWSR